MVSRLLLGLVIFASAAIPGALASQATAASLVFQTEMYGSNEVPPVETSSWGFFRFFFNDDRSAADVTVDVKGMSGPNVISADIHRGAPGETGPVVKHVSDGGFIVESQHVTFTPAELQEMAAGNYYISLKTINHPDGELRGQIIVPGGFLAGAPAPTPTATATATSGQPPVAPAAPAPTPAASSGRSPLVPVVPAGSGGGIRPPNTGDAGLAAD